MALTSLLDEVLEAWQYTRAGVIDEIENLSDTDLKFRPHAESRTAAELAIHIVESGLMMAGELTRPDATFAGNRTHSSSRNMRVASQRRRRSRSSSGC